MRRLSLLIKRLLSFLPTPLPVGLAQFNTWSDSILELSGNYADADSMKFALASMVIHAGPPKNSKNQTQPGFLPKNHFVQGLRKSAANQVASQIFQDIKAKLEAAQKAATEKQKAEVTATSEALTLSGKET